MSRCDNTGGWAVRPDRVAKTVHFKLSKDDKSFQTSKSFNKSPKSHRPNPGRKNADSWGHHTARLKTPYDKTPELKSMFKNVKYTPRPALNPEAGNKLDLQKLLESAEYLARFYKGSDVGEMVWMRVYVKLKGLSLLTRPMNTAELELLALYKQQIEFAINNISKKVERKTPRGLEADTSPPPPPPSDDGSDSEYGLDIEPEDRPEKVYERKYDPVYDSGDESEEVSSIDIPQTVQVPRMFTSDFDKSFDKSTSSSFGQKPTLRMPLSPPRVSSAFRIPTTPTLTVPIAPSAFRISPIQTPSPPVVTSAEPVPRGLRQQASNLMALARSQQVQEEQEEKKVPPTKNEWLATMREYATNSGSTKDTIRRVLAKANVSAPKKMTKLGMIEKLFSSDSKKAKKMSRRVLQVQPEFLDQLL